MVKKGRRLTAPFFALRPVFANVGRPFHPRWRFRALYLGLFVAFLPVPSLAADTVAGKLEASFEERGLGRDAMGVIPNTVFRAGQAPPRATEPGFLRTIETPAKLFDAPTKQFEAALRRAGWNVPLRDDTRHRSLVQSDAAAVGRFASLSHRTVDRWRQSLDRFQRAGGTDRTGLKDTLGSGDIPNRIVQAGLDAGLAETSMRLGKVVLPFAFDLMVAGPSTPHFAPSGVERLEGTFGPDRHRPTGGAGVTLIVDPGGDDTYDFADLRAGSVVIVVDQDGDDSYSGPGGVLSVLVVIDHAGDDRWGGGGPGPSAAFGGIAVLVDLRGDDIYEAGYFGQAAAVLGRALLYDAAGDDTYRLDGLGQGFAGTAGAAVLVDLDGDDRYRAGGYDDAFDRGGRVSKAQGVGFGNREGTAGGIGVLLDRRGDDTYDAEMFAQGYGFYFGMGLLADRAGRDRYTAIRYAQGSSAHVAVGVLVDDAGDDSYLAPVGVSQGMGLDRSIGYLRDGAGNDRYDAGSLAQGASTANGLGVVFDGGGADSFSLAGSGWGEGHWAGGLPGVGALLGAAVEDTFTGGSERQVVEKMPLGGPRGQSVARIEGPTAPVCVAPSTEKAQTGSLAEALDIAYPLAGDSAAAKDAHLFVRRALSHDLGAVIAAVGDNEHRGLGLLGVLRCVVQDQGEPETERIIDAVAARLREGHLAQAWIYAGALVAVERPPGAGRPIVAALASQRDCTALVGAIELARRTLVLSEIAAPDWIDAVVRRGAHSPCWRAQAVALRFGDAVGYYPSLSRSGFPTFLRDNEVRRQAFPAR